ncbi:MAG: YceG family protein [Turicibacter sp.]|nr:YceG family protein [Turicibacter sp.]
MQLEIKQFPLDSGAWLEEFEKSVEKRAGYAIDESKMTYIQVAGIILGLPLEPFTYKKMIFELAYDLEDVKLSMSGQLPRDEFYNRSQSLQKILAVHREQGRLAINHLVALMDEEGLFPLRNNPSYYMRLRATYLEILRQFEKHHQGTRNPDFEHMLTDTISWIWAILAGNAPTKFVWYGDATKSEIYFLYFLYRLGKDILIFHPEGKNILSLFSDNSLPIFRYPTTGPVEAVPTIRPMREATIAKKASTELDQILHQEDSFLFKPWQFREHLPQSVTLHTTFDEVSQLSHAKAFVRPIFSVKGKNIHVPVLFAKICGMEERKVDYARLYDRLLAGDLVVTRQKFPFSWEIMPDFSYQEVLTDGKIDPMKLVRASCWKYGHLSTGLQLGLAHAISRFVLESDLIALPGEDVKPYLFAQALELPKDVLLMLQKFDYSQDVPRIVLFNNGESGQMGRADVARLLLLNEFGVDVIILSPTGQNDIEQYIVDQQLFDTHWLPEISFKETHQGLLELARQPERPEHKVKNFLRGFKSKG